MSESYVDINNQLVKITNKTIKDMFPIETPSKIMTLEGNLDFDTTRDIYFDIPGQKETKLKRKSWGVPVKGVVSVTDKATGKVVSSKKVKLLDMPTMTNRYSFIIDGNEYTSMYQWRLKPGIYTRLTNDGFYESNFNLALMKLDLRLDPQTLLFYLTVGGTSEKFYLYPILKAFYITDDSISKVWGKEIFSKNRIIGLNTELEVLIGFAKKVAGKSLASTHISADEARNVILKYFEGTQLDAKVVEHTVGVNSSKIDADVLLATSNKLLKVMRGEAEEDERDSLAFKNLYNISDRVGYFLDRNLKPVVRKLQYKMRLKDNVEEIITPDTIGKTFKNAFLKDDLVHPNPQTNPLEMLLEARKTTVMGPGGIQSTHAITEEVRNIHPSHIGILDPLQTPEGKKVGITIPLSIYSKKDGQEIKTAYIKKDGTEVFLSPIEVIKMGIGFPEEYKFVDGKPVPLRSVVKGYKDGKPGEYNPKDIDVYLKGAYQLWSLGSSAVPFLNSNSGSRAAMAGRQMTQAVQLVNPDSPLVTVKDPVTKQTWNELFGKSLNIRLPDNITAGKVTKVTKDYIYVKDTKTNNSYKVGLYDNFPLNQESFLQSYPLVKEGDIVDSRTPLARTNFQTPDLSLALGKNISVAYMPWKGLNVEDAVVVTETAANNMFVSESLQRETLLHDNKTILDLNKFRAIFPDKLTYEKNKQYDPDGIIKVGSIVEHGDILIAAAREQQLTPEQVALNRLQKVLSRPYVDMSAVWEFEEPGEVVYVNKGSKKIDVHVKMKMPLKIGDKLCVDEETEILTEDGWKSYKIIKSSDSICTLNPLTKAIEYELPERINIYAHSGEMYRIANSNIDQCVTLNHRMYIKLRDRDNFELIQAKDIIGKRAEYSKAGNWVGAEIKFPKIFDCTSEQYLQFMAWYLSEGCCSVHKHNGYQITISQDKEANPDKHEEIRLLLKAMGFNVYNGKKGLSFHNKDICLYLKQFGKANEKYVPINIKQATKEQIYIFLITYTKGDGNFTKTGQSVITSNSIKMRNDLMELWLKAGYSATYKLVAKEGDYILGNKVNFDIWNIRQIRTKLTPQVNHGHIHTQKIQFEGIIEYDGYVWCPTTKNGIIYTRRNGKCVWTGNSGSFGNKMIVSKIIPDSEAPHTKEGKRADLIMHPFGVVGRTNIGQFLSTAAGKIAEKTGKPYVVTNFEEDDNVAKVMKDLKDNNIEANEIMTDGIGGKEFERPIFIGPQYILKLKHLAEHKIKSRGFGSYDINEQVVKGKEGGQSIDPLQWYAFLAHGLKQNLAETTKYLNVKNDEFWRSVQLGLPTPPVKRNFVWDKFASYLKGSNIDLRREGNMIRMAPLTDKEILELSSGEITQPKFLIGKNLAEIKGGFFDPKLTGGLSGEKYTHIELYKKIPNPVFEDTLQKLMNVTKKEYGSRLERGTLFNTTQSFLENYDVNKELKDAEDKILTAKKLEIPKLSYKIRVLKNLKHLNITPVDAFTMKYFPIIPPKFRPIYPLPNGDLNASPVNYHYRDVGLLNEQLKEVSKIGLELPYMIDAEAKLYKSIKAAQGLGDPVSYEVRKEGLIKTLAGETPADGFIQGKLWRKRRDLSGRAVATVDPQLGIDELAIPNVMAWTIYKPFIIRELVKTGLSPADAAKHYKEQSLLADRALNNVLEQRPIFMNRAPSLHKHSVLAFKPRRTNEMSIKANPLIFSGYNLDFDGDQQINNIIIFVLDKFFENPYISDEEKNNIRNKKMSARYNVKLPVLTGGSYYITNLEDFPHEEEIGSNGNAIFYKVSPYIKVLALDENTNKIILAKVSTYSVHYDRMVEIVDLHNGKQIITDDDPRGVYGLDLESFKFKRSTPTNSINSIAVPIAKNLEYMDNEGSISFIRGNGKLKDKIELNKKTGYILGALIGDGWVDVVNDKPRAVNLAGIEKEVVDQYYSFISELFKEETVHLGYSESTASYGKSEKHIISSVDLAELILPLIGKGAINKHLPYFWFNASKDFKLGLLSGLLDTDGSISTNKSKIKKQLQLNISSLSIRLLQECQQMLLTLGVHSRISFSKKTQADNDFWILSISSVDIQKIKNELIIAHTKNIASLTNTSVSDKSSSYSKLDSIPINTEIIKEACKYISKKAGNSLYTRLQKGKISKYISRDTAKEVLNLSTNLNIPDIWKELVLNENLSWGIVTNVEKTDRIETGYDLSVPGFETFMSVDGIILSNTVTVYPPVTTAAIEEAWNVLPSRVPYKSGTKSVIHGHTWDYKIGLYYATKKGTNTGLSFKTIEDARNYKPSLTYNDVFNLNGQEMTLGLWEANEVLPDAMKDYNRAIDANIYKKLLEEIIENYPTHFVNVINKWKDLGFTTAHTRGQTLSITDMTYDRSFRDKILTEVKKEIKAHPSKMVPTVLEAEKKIVEFQNKQLEKTKNNLWDFLESKAFSGSKAQNINQVMSMVGVISDVKDKPVSVPILKSWSEGQTPFDYWNSLYGSRTGSVRKAISTADSGYLNKSLLINTSRIAITEEDCETDEYLNEEQLLGIHLIGRVLAKTVPGIGIKNEVITKEIYNKIKESKALSVPVRSPLTCEARDNGVCQLCYGWDSNNKFPAIGENVGIADATSITEPLTQGALRVFHTGSKVGAVNPAEGYFRADEILRLKQNLQGAGVLSSDTGKVGAILPNPAGGYNVHIGTTSHYIPVGRELKVKKGESIKAGDPISDGVYKPQEIAALKGINPARIYMVQELQKTLEQKDNVMKKVLENVVKGITDRVVITDNAGDSEYTIGDVAFENTIRKHNKERKEEGLDLIKYRPYLKNIDLLPATTEDWSEMMGSRNIKKVITSSAALGRSANIHGTHPLPGYMYTLEFGQEPYY